MVDGERPAPTRYGGLPAIARAAIERGMMEQRPADFRLEDCAEWLRALRATFVTLHVEGELRGCVGTLEPVRPLAADVAHNAYRAAFRDTRFPPLQSEELPRLQIEVSVLSELERVACATEGELLASLRPGRDGLYLQEGQLGATFLPIMWERLPEPRDFVRQLKMKAGLPPDYWSERMEAFWYTAETVSE